MHVLAAAFLSALIAGAAVRIWLADRQIAAVCTHRWSVPGPFAASISLAEHQKAADYSVATVKFGRVSLLVDTALTLALTLGGGIAAIDELWAHSGWPVLWRGAAVIATVTVVAALTELPLTLWRTFRLESSFGFNRTTVRIFLLDLLKSAAVSILIGGPVILGALALMQYAGRWWWLAAWCGWMGLIFLMTWAWPSCIAPLFNKFTPLADPVLATRINSLLAKCGFESNGVFVVDGSLRSAHGNAYFTGIGRHKRIVFYDTLLQHLSHSEVEAVLAHELGHFRLNHVRNRLLLTMAVSLVALGLLGWLTVQPWLYSSFSVATPSAHVALLLFMYVAPAFTFFFTPLGSLRSRRHEFAADAFAGQHASAADLGAALVKLFRENANTLTPDPWYSNFYYSHPPALERIARLGAAGALTAAPGSPAVAAPG